MALGRPCGKEPLPEAQPEATGSVQKVDSYRKRPSTQEGHEDFWSAAAAPQGAQIPGTQEDQTLGLDRFFADLGPIVPKFIVQFE